MKTKQYTTEKKINSSMMKSKIKFKKYLEKNGS